MTGGTAGEPRVLCYDPPTRSPTDGVMHRYAIFAISLSLVVLAASSGAQTRTPQEPEPPPRVTVTGTVRVLEKGGKVREDVGSLVVYLSGGPAADGETAAPKQKMSSRNKKFEPHVSVVTVGEAMSFPNLDDIMHNVFSLSKGNRFDLGLYKSGASKDHVFAKPGLVRVYCNIHPQMSGFVHVLDSPYYAIASNTGSFRIQDVPPGSYTLTAWHEEGSQSQPIIVTEDGAAVQVDVDVSGYKRRPHLNKFGKPYKRKRGKY